VVGPGNSLYFYCVWCDYSGFKPGTNCWNIKKSEPSTQSQRVLPWPEGPGNLVKLCRAGNRALQLLLFNEESLVSASHQLALITSLPFVHTARRYYRLNGSVGLPDWPREVGNDYPVLESYPTFSVSHPQNASGLPVWNPCRNRGVNCNKV